MERWGEEVRVRSAVYERVEVNVSKACPYTITLPICSDPCHYVIVLL